MEKQHSLGVFGVLRESLKTTIRNGKLVVSIILMVSIFFSLLQFFSSLVMEPLVKDLTAKAVPFENFSKTSEIDETTLSAIKGITKDLGAILVLQLLFLFFTCAILLFFSVSTISSSYEAHTAKVLTLKGMFSKMRGRWGKPIAVCFYMSLISFSVICVALISIGGISAMTTGDYSGYYQTIVASVFVGAFYIYLTAVWMLSLIVSIVEDDCGGLKAIHKAGELMKGKRMQAYAMTLILLVLCLVVSAASFAIKGSLEDVEWIRGLTNFPRIWLVCLVKLFSFVAYTVFYHERVKNYKLDGAVEGGSGLYAPIASSDEV